MAADLSAFDALNAEAAASGKKVPWDQRAALINEKFPSTERLDWFKTLNGDVDLFGRIIRDILKMDLSTTGRPGPRSSLDAKPGTARLKQYMGSDYSLAPFPETLADLAGALSIRGVAAKTGLNRNYVHRLMKGEVDPDLYAIRAVADAFTKHPSYFVEYRARWIASSILDRCETYPETSISIFRRLKEAEAKGDRA